MLEDFQEDQRAKVSRAKSLMDFTMGSLLFLIGVFFLVYRFFGIKLGKYAPSGIDYAIGALFVIYGAYRIYRGYKKDYYR